MNQIETTEHLPPWMFTANMSLGQFNAFQRFYDARANVNQPTNTIGIMGGQTITSGGNIVSGPAFYNPIGRYTTGNPITSGAGNTAGMMVNSERGLIPYDNGMRGQVSGTLQTALQNQGALQTLPDAWNSHQTTATLQDLEARQAVVPLMSQLPGQSQALVHAEFANEFGNAAQAVVNDMNGEGVGIQNLDQTPGGVGITELETEYPNGRLPTATDFANEGLRAAENFAGSMSEATQSSMLLGAVSGGLNMIGNVVTGALNFKAQEDSISQRAQEFQTMAPSLQALNQAEANEYNGKANLLNAQAQNISQSYAYNDSLITRYQQSLQQSGLPGYLAFGGGSAMNFAPRTAATQITSGGNSITSSLPGDPTTQSASGAGITFGQGDFTSPS